MSHPDRGSQSSELVTSELSYDEGSTVGAGGDRQSWDVTDVSNVGVQTRVMSQWLPRKELACPSGHRGTLQGPDRISSVLEKEHSFPNVTAGRGPESLSPAGSRVWSPYANPVTPSPRPLVSKPPPVNAWFLQEPEAELRQLPGNKANRDGL